MGFMKLDTTAAKAAEQKGSFISEAGKYIGKFVYVEHAKNAAKGSEGLNIAFKADSGEEANFHINLSYRSSEGQKQNDGGIKIINAIMACLKLREIPDAEQIQVEKWNKDTKKREQMTVSGFPCLANKRIGLLIQMEIDKSSTDGTPRPTIYVPFSEDEKTAGEILTQTSTGQLAKLMEHIAKKPVVDRRKKGATPQGNGNEPPHSADGFDDDLPW